VYVLNSFTGGNIKIDGGNPESAGTKSVQWWGSARVFEAINYQESDNATQIFQNWITPNDGSPTTLQVSTYPKSGALYTAHFNRRYNVTFSNYLPGGTGGIVKVAGADRTSPYDTTVMDGNSISGQAINQTVSRIAYTFSQWNDGPATNPRTFTPSSHTTYTANFTSKPLPPDNVWAGGTVNDYVHVTWTEHPNGNVTQYQIWRSVKDNGVPGSPELIATVNRGTTSYIDYEFLITSGYTNDIVYYDVRSVFAVEGQATQYSDPYWTGGVFATNDWKIAPPRDGELAQQMELGQPREYSVSSYPNPFNPSTTISYQLAKDAAVRLEIYDIMGRKVRSLVDENRSAGYHRVVWNGRDETGKEVASGVYVYRFAAAPIDGGKAFKQSGKLLLAR
jgi:hypothetical protein